MRASAMSERSQPKRPAFNAAMAKKPPIVESWLFVMPPLLSARTVRRRRPFRRSRKSEEPAGGPATRWTLPHAAATIPPPAPARKARDAGYRGGRMLLKTV